MLVPNQKIKIKWVSANKKWYIEKGYNFTKIWDEFYVKAEDLMPSSKYSVAVKCDYCGKEYMCGYSTYLLGLQSCGKNACYDCKGNKLHDAYLSGGSTKRYNKIKSRCDELGYKLITTYEEIANRCKSIEFVCNTHGRQTLNTELFLKGSICRMCAHDKNVANRRLSMQSRVENEVSRYNNNVLLNKEDYVNGSTKNLKIRCGKCGDVFITSRDLYLKNCNRNENYACPKCNVEQIRQRMLNDVDDVESYINSINGNKLLNKNDYAGNDICNLNIICGCCGEMFTTSLACYQAGKTMCDKCSSSISRGELRVKDVLDSYNISYTREFWFDDCRDKNPLPFDFYLPDYNTACEVQGKQHYEPVEYFGGEESFVIRVNHDNIKRNYCKQNNITLIEIPYWEYNNIEDILVDNLHLHTDNTKDT